MAELPDVMTPQQVADYLQLHVMTIYRHIHDGRLPATKIGGRYRLKREHVEELLAKTDARKAEYPQGEKPQSQ